MTEQPPSDPAEHAKDFARRYAEPLDYHAGQTMIELGIPTDRIGARDPDNGFRHASFHPTETTGGSFTPDGRITLDSGVMNLSGMDAPYGEKAGKVWACSGLKDRMQAIVAHEQTEIDMGSHDTAVQAAPETAMPISHRAREVLRALRAGWKRG